MKIKALHLPRILLGMILFGSSPLLGQPDLTLYTYDSFNSEWGPGPVVFKRFEEKCQCILKVVAPGDSGSMLNRAILEKNNPRADLVLGINNSELDKSFRYGIWESYRSQGMMHSLTGFNHKKKRTTVRSHVDNKGSNRVRNHKYISLRS